MKTTKQEVSKFETSLQRIIKRDPFAASFHLGFKLTLAHENEFFPNKSIAHTRIVALKDKMDRIKN